MQSLMPQGESLEALLVWLCSIASPTGEEDAIAHQLYSFLCRCGVTTEQVRRYGKSLYVELTRDRSGPSIALVGHTDVVRTQHDAPPRIEGDRIYGPGASDMKSGLALMLGLLTNPVETAANLTLIFYASEEGPYENDELQLVIDQEPRIHELDFALVLEPTDGQLQLGCGGTLHAEVTFAGKSAHSARPWQGENAIYRSVGLLTRLAALTPEPRRVDGLEWMKSMSATLARGGRAPNVIPDRFTINVNARFAPDQSPAEVQAEVLNLVGGEAEVEFVDCSPPALPYRDHPFIAALESAGAESVLPKFGWTDVARLSPMGIPAANFGPGTLSQAHQSNEWTSLTELYRSDSILRKWLSSMPAAYRKRTRG
jgi:succinyl-diaminopimelate desuccinylase